MVLQVFADTGERMEEGDARFFQNLGISNSGLHEDHGREEGARAQDDLTGSGDRFVRAALADRHAYGPAIVKVDPRDRRFAHDVEVFARPDRVQKRPGHVHSAALGHGGLIDPGAFLGVPIEVFIHRILQGRRRFLIDGV